MVEMPGYRLPRSGDDTVCVPFLQTANKPPPGYRGSDYYVAEFTDDRLKARWTECKADNARLEKFESRLKDLERRSTFDGRRRVTAPFTVITDKDG